VIKGSKKIILLIYGLLLITFNLQGQNVKITGRIYDEEDNNTIGSVIIFVNPDKIYSQTNSSGEYTIVCRPGKINISTRVLGYKSSNITLFLTSDSLLNIYLKKAPLELKEVPIIADSVKSINISDQGSIIVTSASIYETPKQFSEPDLLKSLQLLPGVISGRDGSAEMFVRGGDSGQNVVLANGCFFYLPSHLLGLVSPYDLDFIEKSELVKDYFPPYLGGGASSVIKVDYKGQVSDSLKAKLRFGLLSSGIIFQIPFKKLKLGISGGIKKSNYTFYSGLLKKILDKEIIDFLPPDNYSFYDAFLQVTHSSPKLGRLNYLYIGNYDNGTQKTLSTSLSADTVLSSTDIFSIGWKSITHALQWYLPTESRVKVRFDLNFNRLDFNRDMSQINEKKLGDVTLAEFNSSSFEFSPLISNIGSALSFARNDENLSYSAGIYYRMRYFHQNISASNNNNGVEIINEFGENSLISEPALFIDTKALLPYHLQIEGGLRLSGCLTQNSNYFLLEPRLRLIMNPEKKISPHLNFVKISQFDHSVEASNIGLRSMIWLPVNSAFGPEISNIFSVGFLSHINEKYILSFDGYFKNISGMVEFKPGASFLFDTSFNELLDKVKGRAWGFEIYLIKKIGKLTGSLSYTYSRSKREWLSPEGLIWIPSNADRPQNANISIKYSFGKRTSVGLGWVYISGSPASLYIHRTIYGQWFETKNNIRYPDYHRLDISFRHIIKFKLFSINIDADVYNAYNRKNTFYLKRIYNSQTGKNTYRNIALFPIMPSISISINY
jgi:hypothetical protein